MSIKYTYIEFNVNTYVHINNYMDAYSENFLVFFIEMHSHFPTKIWPG